MNREKGSADSGALFVLAICLGSFAAWLTHIVVCLKAGSWGFLIAGAIFAPIGVVHGVGIWFGAW